MNNMPYPFFQHPSPTNIYEEIKKIKEELYLIKEKLKLLENTPKKDYLKKDDSFHILWTQKCSFFLIFVQYINKICYYKYIYNYIMYESEA